MAYDEYPDKIERKRDDFNTTSQSDAADLLESEWPVNMTELEEVGPNSRALYQKVRDQYFGPVGDERTFSEIKDDFGTVKAFVEQRAEGEERPDETDIEDIDGLSPENLKWFKEGVKFARQLEKDDE